MGFSGHYINRIGHLRAGFSYRIELFASGNGLVVDLWEMGLTRTQPCWFRINLEVERDVSRDSMSANTSKQEPPSSPAASFKLLGVTPASLLCLRCGLSLTCNHEQYPPLSSVELWLCDDSIFWTWSWYVPASFSPSVFPWPVTVFDGQKRLLCQPFHKCSKLVEDSHKPPSDKTPSTTMSGFPWLVVLNPYVHSNSCKFSLLRSMWTVFTIIFPIASKIFGWHRLIGRLGIQDNATTYNWLSTFHFIQENATTYSKLQQRKREKTRARVQARKSRKKRRRSIYKI